MSKQPVANPNLKPRVSGGVPWWIWGMMVLLGGFVVLSFLQRSIPEDPAELFKQGLAAAEKQDAKTLKINAEKLAAYPEFATKKKLLDGLILLGGSRPVKAISYLKEASEEPELRSKALMFLGSAYAQSENLQGSVETFEAALKEDAEAHETRLRLASVYKELLALDASLSHLEILIKAGHKPLECNKLKGDMLFVRQQYAEAANAYEAAIKVDKNSPINSVIAERLIQCLLMIKEPKRAEEYLSLVDQSSTTSIFEAEELLQAGDLTRMADVVDALRKNAQYNPRGHILYGQLMLKKGTPEKAVEGLAGLKSNLLVFTRNVELCQVVADLADMAGDEKLAVAAKENVAKLQALRTEFLELFTAVSKTQEGFDDRFKLAHLAQEIGELEFSSEICQSLTHAYPDKATQIEAFRDRLYHSLPLLVELPFPAATESSAPASGAPAEGAAEKSGEQAASPEAASTPETEAAPPAETK